MSSSITTFIATALVLFLLGQAIAARAAEVPPASWGTELSVLKR